MSAAFRGGCSVSMESQTNNGRFAGRDPKAKGGF
jgi:hypothetical protein